MVIKTSKIAAFLNIGTTEKPEWARIKKQGELKLKYDASTSEDKFIDEDAPTTNVDSYAVGFDGELTCYTDDKVFSYIDGLRRNRATGSEAETECVVVYMYDGDTTAGFAAEKNRCVIQTSEFGGEGGGGKVSLNYSCNFNGDPEIGTATVTSDSGLTFTKTA